MWLKNTCVYSSDSFETRTSSWLPREGFSKVEIWVCCGHPDFGVKIEQTAQKGWIGLLPNQCDQRVGRMHNPKEAISDLISYFKKWIGIRKICHLTMTVQGKFGISKIRSYTSFERSSTWSCKQVILDVPSLLNKKNNDIVNIYIMRWNDLQFICSFSELQIL